MVEKEEIESSPYAALAKLRILVGALGEQDKFNWWPTSFFASSSKMFLEPIYPRTVHLAQYHSVVEAARCVHDEYLNAGTFHLFRLPEEIEQDLHALITSWSTDNIQALIGPDDAATLKALVDFGTADEEAVDGPILCGSVQEFLSETTMSKISSLYAAAFIGGRQTYPYLMSAE